MRIVPNKGEGKTTIVIYRIRIACQPNGNGIIEMKEEMTMKHVINSKKAVMIGCGFVGSASVFALMQSGLFTEIASVSGFENPVPTGILPDD